MNKKKLICAAVLLACAAPAASWAAPERTAWVLSGKDGTTWYVNAEPQGAAHQQAEASEAEKAASPERDLSEKREQTGVLPASEDLQGESRKAVREAPAEEAARSGEEASAAAGESRASAEPLPRDGKSGGQAETGAAASISAENPLVVKADSMRYSSATGDVDLEGRVDMTHMQDRYETERIYGNSKSQSYVLPVPVKWSAPGNVSHAESGTYDGRTGVSTFQKISGWNQDKYYYQGESGEFSRTENKGVVQKGYFTTKHAVAKVPDYRIEADSIEIYPNDHYVAHHPSLFFKNHRILTLSSYSGSLKHDDVSMWSLIPMPAYDSDNGFGLRNRITIPVGGIESGLFFYSNLRWYTDAGFKPDVGFQWNTAPGTFKFRYAKEESSLNDDHVWVEKRPSFSFDSRHFYIPRTNFYVGTRGELGYWKEGHVEGSHKLWDVYLSHDPIAFGPHLSFQWRLGYLRDYYGYNNLIRSNRYYSVGLSGGYGIVHSWINYTDNDQDGYTPYSFDTYDMDKPVNTGMRLRLTRLDSIGVSYSIDTQNGHLEHRDFTYYRDMHSFYGWITYRDIDRETQIMIQPKDFSF